ncbi:MAG: tRNA uridine-5-carboxymethylaminomethyl(34) synthesis enzyme MnmG, partial [Rhodothermia bacterium]|nr:tRNA uridine-5-carboxymethylaminomethyl(34) synthesis enzyme MnmG [Rhodothermia bacterium]
RERDLVRKMEQLESWSIPRNFDYALIDNITMEAREKLAKIQPDNLGQASRVSGVSPADISVLMVLLKRGRSSRRETVSA